MCVMEPMTPVPMPDLPDPAPMPGISGAAPVPLPSARPETRLLPVFDAPSTGRVWLVAAHGGAGCTTIYRSAPSLYADAGRALPYRAAVDDPPRIVLCATGSCQGLEALRGLLAEWVDGALAPCVLLGVAVTACMRRPPGGLRRGCLQVGSVAPRLWRLPYMPSVPVDGVPPSWPAAYRRMAADIERSPR